MIVRVVFGVALLIGLAYAAFGSTSATSTAGYSAHTYCTRDVPAVRSLWTQSPDAASQAANTMSLHAAGLGNPYAMHAEALTTLIAAAQDARVQDRHSVPRIDAAVTNAWAQVLHDCHP